MAVEVVAVGGVDVVAQPDAGVGEHDLGPWHVPRDGADQLALVGREGRREPERPLAPESGPLEGRSHKLVVVVSGHDHNLLAGGGASEIRKERRRGRQHRDRRPLAHLEQIAEHHYAVGRSDRLH